MIRKRQAGLATVVLALSWAALATAAATALAAGDTFTITPTGGNGASISWTNNGSTTENAIAVGLADYSNNSLTNLAFPGASSCHSSGSGGGWFCFVDNPSGSPVGGIHAATLAGTLTTQQPVTSGEGFVVCPSDSGFVKTTTCTDVNAASPCANVQISVSGVNPMQAVLNKPYGGSVSASGGTAPYTFTSTSFAPTGLALGTDGSVTGRPTEASRALHDGTVTSFLSSVTATDSKGCAGTGNVTLAVYVSVGQKLGVSNDAGTGFVRGLDCSDKQACEFLLDLVTDTAAPKHPTAGDAAGGVKVATAKGAVKPGKRGGVPLKMTKKGLKLLKKNGKLETTALGTVKSGSTTTPVTATVTVKLLKQ